MLIGLVELSFPSIFVWNPIVDCVVVSDVEFTFNGPIVVVVSNSTVVVFNQCFELFSKHHNSKTNKKIS